MMKFYISHREELKSFSVMEYLDLLEKEHHQYEVIWVVKYVGLVDLTTKRDHRKSQHTTHHLNPIWFREI